MLPGLMQSAPLQISGILRHAAMAFPTREIVSRLVDEPLFRYDYAGLARRAAKVAHLMAALGVEAGDRVTSLAWNTHRHLELFYGVPGMGAVLHTANPRLSDDQIIYTINHAESGVLLFDRSFLALVQRLRPHLTRVRHFIQLSAADLCDGFESYETLLAAQDDAFDWPVFRRMPGPSSATPPARPGTPRGCSIPTVRWCCTPWRGGCPAPSASPPSMRSCRAVPSTTPRPGACRSPGC